MKRSDKGRYKAIATWLLAALVLGNIARGQLAEFTYQGWLSEWGQPASGLYQMRFTMHATGTGETIVAGPVTNPAVAVVNGLFTCTLDFGQGLFDGSRRWLEVAVATNGSDTLTVLLPRQEIRPTPYAIRAARVDGTISSNGLAGSYTQPVALLNPANVFAGDGSGLTHVQAATLEGLGEGDFWKIGGNSGNGPNSFLGTIDREPLELRVNNKAGLRLEASMSGGVNVVGGNSTIVMGAADGATIAGGISNVVECLAGSIVEGGTVGGGVQNILANTPYGTIGGGSGNRVYESFYGSIGGGSSNLIGSAPAGFYQTYFAFVGGGIANWIQDGVCSLIVGGAENQVDAFTEHSAVVGGHRNAIRANSRSSSIGGGEANQVFGALTASEAATIAGGRYNEVQGRAPTIGGGEENQMWGRRWATIGGGARNKSGAQASTIAGGIDNYIFGDDFGIPQSPNTTIGGGNGNMILYGAAEATISGGRGNTVTGSDASNYRAPGGTIGGGASNRVSHTFGTIPGGSQAAALNYGQLAYASGSFATPGDAQMSTYVCRGFTRDEIPAELFLDGLSRRIAMPTNSTWTFDILVSGRAETGTSACYRLWGAAKNHGGITTLFGKLKQKTIGEDDETWDVTASASGTDNTWAVQVIGARDTSIRWVATVRTAEVSY